MKKISQYFFERNFTLVTPSELAKFAGECSHKCEKEGMEIIRVEGIEAKGLPNKVQVPLKQKFICIVSVLEKAVIEPIDLGPASELSGNFDDSITKFEESNDSIA